MASPPARALTLPVLVTENDWEEGRKILDDVSEGLDIKKDGAFRYIPLPDGTVSLVAWDGKGETLTVPDTLGGCRVTALGVEGYRLIKPVIPDTVESFTLPSSLRSIHAGSVALGKRKSFSVPEGVELLEGFAENANYDLQTITLPSTLRTLGRGCFAYFMKLRRLKIPEGVEEIGDQAFYRSEIQYVQFPSSIKRIGNLAFFDCRNLEDAAFPEGLESIGERAFESCSSLTRAVLPSSLRTLGAWAFALCTGMYGLHFREGSRLKTLPEGAFSGSDLRKAELPEGLEEVMDSAFSDCRRLTVIRVPGTLKNLSAEAFSGISQDAVFTVVGNPEAASLLRKAGFQVREKEK